MLAAKHFLCEGKRGKTSSAAAPEKSRAAKNPPTQGGFFRMELNFCLNPFKVGIFGHTVFKGLLNLSLNKRHGVFDKFFVYVVTFFVYPFARNKLFNIRNFRKGNKLCNALIAVGHITAESNHLAAFAGNGGFNGITKKLPEALSRKA